MQIGWQCWRSRKKRGICIIFLSSAPQQKLQQREKRAICNLFFCPDDNEMAPQKKKITVRLEREIESSKYSNLNLPIDGVLITFMDLRYWAHDVVGDWRNMAGSTWMVPVYAVRRSVAHVWRMVGRQTLKSGTMSCVWVVHCCGRWSTVHVAV